MEQSGNYIDGWNAAIREVVSKMRNHAKLFEEASNRNVGIVKQSGCVGASAAMKEVSKQIGRMKKRRFGKAVK